MDLRKGRLLLIFKWVSIEVRPSFEFDEKKKKVGFESVSSHQK